MNKKIMKEAGFGPEVAAVEDKICPLCGADIKDVVFRDELSKQEYKISGLCQKCQDDIFG